MQFDNSLRSFQLSGNKIVVLLYLGPLKALQSMPNARIILSRRTVVDKRVWLRASFSDSTYEINIA